MTRRKWSIKRKLLRRFVDYYATHPTWGSMHIVLDDGNYGAENASWCAKFAREIWDIEGAELADELAKMPEWAQRALAKRVTAIYEQEHALATGMTRRGLLAALAAPVAAPAVASAAAVVPSRASGAKWFIVQQAVISYKTPSGSWAQIENISRVEIDFILPQKSSRAIPAVDGERTSSIDWHG